MTYPTELTNPAQANWPVVVNENAEALAHIAVYANNYLTTTGLTWGYHGGRWGGFSVADGTHTLTNAADNYIVVLRSSGVASVSTSTANWNDTAAYARVYKVTTAGGLVTAVEDHRAGPSGVHGSAADAATEGLSWKSPVRAVTPAATLLPAAEYDNGTSGVGATLTGETNGTLATQDGLTIVVGNRLLVKNETNAAWNGIYQMTQLGDGSTPYILTRETDADTGSKLLGAVVLVTEGSANAETVWICETNAPITVGSTDLDWVQLDLGTGITGPGTSTDQAIARWDGTAGGVVQDSSVAVDDDGAIHNYRAKINAQTGTTYTLEVADSGKIIDHSNAAAISVTLPNDAPQGFACTYVQAGAGQITFAVEGGGSAVLRNRQSHTKTAGQWAEVALHVRSNSGGTAAEWVLAGDTAA